MKKFSILAGALVILFGLQAQLALAGGYETYNGCRATTNNPCLRTGHCSIQGSAWDAFATIDRSDRFDTQGWPGLCDMMHVAMVQGNCEPIGSQDNIIAYLSTLSYAEIPSVTGTLACGGDGGRHRQ
jgi:hypothetical protein